MKEKRGSEEEVKERKPKGLFFGLRFRRELVFACSAERERERGTQDTTPWPELSSQASRSGPSSPSTRRGVAYTKHSARRLLSERAPLNRDHRIRII